MPEETEPKGVSKLKALVEQVAPKFPQRIDRSPGALSPDDQIAKSPGYSALNKGLKEFTLVELNQATIFVSEQKHKMTETHPENPLELSQRENAIWYSFGLIYAASLDKMR